MNAKEAKQHHDGYLAGATNYAKLAGHSCLKSKNEVLCYVLDHYSWMGHPAGPVLPPEDASRREIREFLDEAGIDMKPAVDRVKAALADERDCLDLAGQIADAVEEYEGDDLLSQIVPLLRPIIGRLDWLRKCRHDAILALDEALGDTDIAHAEDESPVFRAFVALTGGATVKPRTSDPDWCAECECPIGQGRCNGCVAAFCATEYDGFPDEED